MYLFLLIYLRILCFVNQLISFTLSTTYLVKSINPICNDKEKNLNYVIFIFQYKFLLSYHTHTDQKLTKAKLYFFSPI